jgi:hypothetical protein
MIRGFPSWAQALLMVLFLGVLQLVITSLSNQNKGIVDRIRRVV